jgi:putative ABC transport system permease protein
VRAAGTGVFRAFARSLPKWFRRKYGRDMVVDFELRSARIRQRSGRFAALLFTVRSLVEVLGVAVKLRFRRDGAPDHKRSEGGGWVDDVRHAARSLARAPGWTGAALLILTLGIGGTTAVFTVLNTVLLRPLPYEDPAHLVSIWTVNRVQDLRDGSSYENGRDWATLSRGLEDVAFVLRPEFTNATVLSFGEPERIHVGMVSPNFFELLGVRAVAGRVFGGDDLRTDTHLAVISEALWTTRYGRASEALGQTLIIDGEPSEIVGVVPGEVAIPLRETHIWRALDVRTPEGRNWRGFDAYWVIGRLAAGLTPEAAQAELDPIAADLAVRFPETNRDRGVRVRSLHADLVGERVPLLLWTILASMGLVLLIGGANVAQLMLGRAIERRREMAVRASLGATRRRMNRQLLIESALLSVSAGVGGLVVAHLALEGLLSLVPPDVPLIDQVHLDGAVLLMAFALTGVLAPMVGLLPALVTTRADAAEVLRVGGRGSTGDRRLRSALVVAELAMAAVLLMGSGLLVRSALALQAVDPGFDARHTLMARVDLSPSEEGDPLIRPAGIIRDVGTLPGVLGVSVIGQFFIERFPDQTINVLGAAPRPSGAPAPKLTTDQVYPGFFEGLGVPLLKGRALGFEDVGEDFVFSTVVVNQKWVDTFADGRDPIGLQFRWGDQTEGEAVTVVGVVADLRRTTLDEPPYPQMFTAGAGAGLDLLVRMGGEALGVAPRVREAIREHDPLAAVSRVGTAWERYDVGMAPRHFQMLMFSTFAALATLLAAIGLFAVLHDVVAARRREIGIRLALGAAPAGVRRMVLTSGIGLAIVGLAIGLGATWLLSGVLARLVYGIRSTDAVTTLAVTACLLTVSLGASLLPALRATRVPPAETLSSE